MAETTDLSGDAPPTDQLSEAEQAFIFWTTLSPGAQRAVLEDADLGAARPPGRQLSGLRTALGHRG